jgi:iron-sulfur cluster assembly protein
MIEDKKLGGLRVKVEGGGCSGFQYDLSFDVWDNDDMVFWADSEEEHNKFPIIVDKRTILYLAGSQINYHDGLMGSGFAVENPNANSTCGCGESFSI